MDIRTPLTKTRSFKVGTSCVVHWWYQRVTAIALIPLSLWFGFALMSLPGTGFGEVVEWIQRPWNTLALVVFIMASFYHAILGIQVVLEDYVHTEWLQTKSILATKMALIVVALLMLFAVLKVAFTG